MGLFGFGKKKEENNSGCGCSCSCSQGHVVLILGGGCKTATLWRKTPGQRFSSWGCLPASVM